MNDQRYASLSGQLLARKGAARPAMRPRPLTTSSMEDLGWDDMGFDSGTNRMPVNSLAALTPAPRPQAVHADIHEDLHQDLHEPPVVTPVHEQQQAIAESFAHESFEELGVQAVEEPAAEPVFVAPQPVAEVVKTPRRAAGTTGRKAAFTLRLDADRHLKLRLATAVTGRSAQQLVTAALDQFIESLPDVAGLASHLPARSGH